MTSLASSRSAEQLALRLDRNASDRSPQPELCSAALLAADLVAMALAFSAAVAVASLVFGPASTLAVPGGRPAALAFAALFAWTAGSLGAKGRYTQRRPFAGELRAMLATSGTAAAALAVLALPALAVPGGDASVAMAAIGAVLLLPALATAANRLTKFALARAGLWTLDVVLIGDDAHSAEVEAALEAELSLDYRIVRRVDPRIATARQDGPRLRQLLDQSGAQRLLIALDDGSEPQRKVVEAALRERVPFAVAPQPAAFPAFSHHATRFLGRDVVLLSFWNGLSRPASRAAKAAIDVTLAAILLIAASPFFLAIAVANTIDGGPIFFAHRRVGAGGRSFRCLKFRTMRVDGDRILEEALRADPAVAAEWQATHKLRHDPRVTPVGRILRKTSLDELPQLINILRMEMSLVGPRPIVEGEVPKYGQNIAQYYATRPGLTGLWQVSGRSNTSYERRVELDTWYVNNWSLWHDLTVLAKTVPAVLARSGAH